MDISIIIHNYNVEKHMKRCHNGVFNQIICLFKKMHSDIRIHKVISYINNHSDILIVNQQKLRFSKTGTSLILDLPCT